MAGKPGLPRPESVGAGCCWKGAGLGDWDEDRETPLCWWSWVEKTNCISQSLGCGGKGMRQEWQAGEMGPTSVPSFIFF